MVLHPTEVSNKTCVGFFTAVFASLQQRPKEKQISEYLHAKKNPISSLNEQKKIVLAIACCLLTCLYTNNIKAKHSLVGESTSF